MTDTLDCETVRERLLTAGTDTFEALRPHLDHCPSCRALAERVRLTEGLMPHTDSLPARLPRWTPIVVGLAAAATLLLVGVPVVRQLLPTEGASGSGLADPAAAYRACSDLIRLEPTALMGRLTDAERSCLDRMSTDHADVDTRHAALAVLVKNAASRQASDSEARAAYVELATRYAQTFPSRWKVLPLFLALDLDTEADAARTVASVLRTVDLEMPGLEAYADGAAPSPELRRWHANTLVGGFPFFRSGDRRPSLVLHPVEIRSSTPREMKLDGRTLTAPASVVLPGGPHEIELDGSTGSIEIQRRQIIDLDSLVLRDEGRPPPGSVDTGIDDATTRKVMAFYDTMGLEVTVADQSGPAPASFELAPGRYFFGVDGKEYGVDVPAGDSTFMVRLHQQQEVQRASTPDRIEVSAPDLGARELEVMCPSGFRQRAAFTDGESAIEGVPPGRCVIRVRGIDLGFHGRGGFHYDCEATDEALVCR